MADAVDAIIVVGPVLWKCVQCDLLVSRHHSIDQHLRASHQSAAGSALQHKDSLETVCRVPKCYCRDLHKNKKGSSRKKTGCNKEERVDFANSRNSLIALDDVEEKEVEADENNDNSTVDDEELPQSLRDLVEQASKAKEKKALNNATDENTESMCFTDRDPNLALPVGVENSTLKSTEQLCENEDSVETSSTRTSMIAEYMDSSIPNVNSAEESSLTSVPDSETEVIKRSCVFVVGEVNSDEKPSKKLKNEMSSKKEEADKGKELAKILTSPNDGRNRRTSGRATKGKNSIYSDYQVEIT